MQEDIDFIIRPVPYFSVFYAQNCLHWAQFGLPKGTPGNAHISPGPTGVFREYLGMPTTAGTPNRHQNIKHREYLKQGTENHLSKPSFPSTSSQVGIICEIIWRGTGLAQGPWSQPQDTQTHTWGQNFWSIAGWGWRSLMWVVHTHNKQGAEFSTDEQIALGLPRAKRHFIISSISLRWIAAWKITPLSHALPPCLPFQWWKGKLKCSSIKEHGRNWRFYRS